MQIVQVLLHWCRRLTLRKRGAVLTALLLPVIVYAAVLIYTAHRLLPAAPSRTHRTHRTQREHRPYVLSADGRSLYEEGQATEIASTQICLERRNMVFLKVMKCATSTLLGLFNRFAYKRNLSVALPPGKQIYHNWPYPMTRRDVRPTGRGEYNMILHHAVYTPAVMRALMPPDAVYISIVREPFSQLQSAFRYFNVAEISGVPASARDPLLEYFGDVEQYEKVYMSPAAKSRWCIPDGFSVTRNLMSHCHGMPLGFPPGTRDITRDAAATDAYIRQLGRSFELVMVAEYLFESLVLLRRLMCWRLQDIVFVSSNVAPKTGKERAAYPRHLLEFHKRWSHADYRLYDYFNATLWRLVARQGPGFSREVKAFKAVQSRVEQYCAALYFGDGHAKTNNTIRVPPLVEAASEWTRSFTITAEDCWALGPDPFYLTNKMKEESDTRDEKILRESSKLLDERQHKGLC
ncbi:galactose-3-o-sulfotransferase 3 [Plakobranchus ocellatus]|uniref:Galactose-3-o-sulfotransferase 3 n=1 Tax=Plakobranchus ocellatus TaxID=259542 RepID=A0AAV4CU78_9GAST|nr:galactose-3-o-sulfotransferase 3 [Plakobranchus ocellatus]